MTFNAYLGGVLLVLIPVVLIAAFTKGIDTLHGTRIQRRDRPVLFWVFLLFWVALIGTISTLMMADDPRGEDLLRLVPFVFILLACFRGIRAMSRPRAAPTSPEYDDRIGRRFAFAGLILFTLLMFAYAVYLTLDLLGVVP